MASPELGRIEPLQLRDLWKHEERDFTPWLATNIDQLSEVIGLPIIVDQTEHKVGAYELDIRGHIGESDKVVIIENQLEATDHGHLGQLMSYAAGLDAAVVIWIAPDVRDEHRLAIEWLNGLSTEKVSFYLIRPEVFRVDNSKPAIRFFLEAGPSEFNRRLQSVIEESEGPRHEFRRRFWEGLFEYLSQNGHPWAKGRSTTKDSWISSAVGRSGIAVNVSMAQGSRIRVEIWCTKDVNKDLHNRLLEKKEVIETRLPGEAVSWERLNTRA